jgi:cytoskeletal protein RodZ
MQTVGTYLKSSRESKNISLSEISQHTKIPKWYLDSLEKDDFTTIPGGPYIKGYISSYAGFIGIDEEEAIKKYDSSNKEAESSSQADTGIRKSKQFHIPAFVSKKIWFLGLNFIIITLLLAGIYHFIFQGSEDTTLQRPSKNPAQNETPASNEQVAELPPDRPTLKIADSDIQNSVIPKNLQSESAILPEPINNKPANVEVSENAKQMKASNTEASPLYADPVRPKEQIQPNTEDGIKVVKAVAGEGVQNRNPVDTGNSFRWSKGRVYIWSMINCSNPPSSIKHIYYFKEQMISEVILDINSHQWRTWSYKTISDKRYIGQWRVDITSAEDKVLKTIQFEVN